MCRAVEGIVGTWDGAQCPRAGSACKPEVVQLTNCCGSFVAFVHKTNGPTLALGILL